MCRGRGDAAAALVKGRIIPSLHFPLPQPPLGYTLLADGVTGGHSQLHSTFQSSFIHLLQ